MTTEKKIERLTGFDPFQVYTGTPLGQPGEGDLFMDLSTKQVIGRSSIFLQLAGQEGDKLPRFKGTTVIAPPEVVWDVSEADVRTYVTDAINDMRQEPATPEELAYIDSSVSMIRCTDLSIDGLIKMVQATSENQLLMIVEASRYRDPEIRLNLKVGRSASWTIEDEWVPHVANLTSSCLPITKAMGSYVVFIASHPQPVSQDNIEILNAVDGLYASYVNHDVDADKLLHEKQKDWIAKVLEGKIADVLSEINATPIHPDLKTQLSIQFVARSGEDQLTAKLIRDELAKGMNHPPDIVIRFARLAEKAGDVFTGNLLRQRTISLINDRHLLEETLLSATDLDNAALIEIAYSRLSALFPTSIILSENRELRLLRCCQMTVKREDLTAYCSGFDESYLFLVQTLFDQHHVNYDQVLNEISERWPSDKALAAYCCALHAQTEEMFVEAMEMAVQVSAPRYAPLAASIVLSIVRRMMLKNLIPRDQLDLYKLPLRFVIGYLAEHPSDGRIRNMLASILSVEACGAIGLPILISLTLDIVAEGAHIESNPSLSPAASESEFVEFMPVVLQWMQSEKVIELGVTSLPNYIAGGNPKGLIAYLLKLIRFSAHARGEDVDLPFLDKCVHIVCLLAPHAEDHQSDLEALRFLASRYAVEGYHQKARDLAEQILMLANSNHRNRIAWAAFADIYHRTRGRIDALIAFSSAAATDAPIDLASLWQEAFGLLRMARDIGLHEIANRLLAACKELGKRLQLDDVGELRLTIIELGLKFSKIGDEDKAYLEQLLADTVAHCERSINLDDELSPVLSLLSQLIPKCEEQGISIDSRCQTMLQIALSKVGPSASIFLQTISNKVPTSNDVLGLQKRANDTRSSDDAANDMSIAVMAARRLLRSSIESASARDVCYAIEVLSEKSIDIHIKKRTFDVEWPAAYMKQLATTDLVVTVMAITDDGDLVTATADGSGDIKLTCSAQGKERFADALNQWTADYPFRYGIIERDEGNNEFYQSMEKLDIPLIKAKNILVIPDPNLQQVPMNLVMHTREFIGKDCAIGTAPSLEWLDASHRKARQHDGRRLAWISASDNPEEFKTLEVALGRLEPTLTKFGFQLDTSREIPSNFSGAQMALVTAHGSLTTESRFIQRISDEGVMTESPIALARALAGVEVVILFVCSGGRLDRHPHANTTVGLPKLLLDRGSRVVIASPWPLTILVTYHWLDAFMAAWDAGDTVLDATFKGNAGILSALGDPPQYGLAMTVHGDVFLRKS